MKIFTCRSCNRKMIANPLHEYYEDVMMTDPRQSRYLCTLPDCIGSCEPSWFLDYNEYLQKQSIKAWK